MPHAVVRPDTLYAWSGQSLLVVNTGGECADDQRLTGYYFRETRFLRTLQLRINGHPPWPCEAASIAPDTLLFTYVHPEITMPSGGGTGQAGDEENTDRDGVPERAIDICVTYTVRAGWLDVRTVVANRAANRGAGVVLAARNENDLRAACHEIRQHGGRAVYVVADVSRPEDVKRIGEAAIAEFGRIDTWVNNAAVSTYGKTFEVPLEDMRRQMDVSFWGQVYGSREAVSHLRRRGGALVNVASGIADRAIPLLGIYCAAKHALKAFSDVLRLELEKEGVPISPFSASSRNRFLPFTRPRLWRT